MGTEIFLILLTLCASFVKKSEAAPALLYTIIAFLFYFISLSISSPFLLLLGAMGMEVVTIFLLICLKGCLNSKMVTCLIPLSIGAFTAHFLGLCMFQTGLEMGLYNNFVDIYWAIIIGLFLSMSRWVDGNYIKLLCFFRRYDNQHKTIQQVLKCSET